MNRFLQLDQFNYHQTLSECRGSCIVIFTAPGCGSCKSWLQLLGAYRARHPQTQVYEVDCQRDQALAREYEVFHLPALFLYQDGQFHCQLQCEATLEILTSAIAKALCAPAQDQP